MADIKTMLMRKVAVLIAVVLLICLVGCGKQEKPAETQAQAAPITFATPDDAAKALVDAAKADNREAMPSIFGPGSKDLIYSGDAAEDKASFAGFVADYDAMHRWRKLDNGSELLITGVDNKTFPIPLKHNGAGQWLFDTSCPALTSLFTVTTLRCSTNRDPMRREAQRTMSLTAR